MPSLYFFTLKRTCNEGLLINLSSFAWIFNLLPIINCGSVEDGITELHWGTGAYTGAYCRPGLTAAALETSWSLRDLVLFSQWTVVVISRFHGIPELSTWFCLYYKDGFMKAALTILVCPFGLWQLCQNKCRFWSYLIWEPCCYTDNTNGWYGRWKGRNCTVLLSATSDSF